MTFFLVQKKDYKTMEMDDHFDIYVGDGIHITSEDYYLLLKERMRVVYDAYPEQFRVSQLLFSKDYERYRRGEDVYDIWASNPTRFNPLDSDDCIYDVLDVFSKSDSNYDYGNENAIIWLNSEKPERLATFGGGSSTRKIFLWRQNYRLVRDRDRSCRSLTAWLPAV